VELKPRVNQALRDGAAWLAKNYSVSANPGGSLHHYYYLYGLERAGRRGTNVHKYFERGLRGEPFNDPEFPDEPGSDYLPAVRQFFDTYQPELVAAEVVSINRILGYGGTGDWLCRPELYPRYGKWIESFVRRYWKDGKGGLWGLENYNEPWEGGGISGWASDSPRYRDLQKLIATSAKKVDPKVRILAASSIMNTEDKLYSDGSNQMDDYIDIFTDHYVPPVGCYGPMVAKAHGKGSMETETWFVNSEYSLPQGVVQFLASGQSRIAPWHPRVLFDTLPGNSDRYVIPAPVTVATAAFNALVTGKPFEKMVFTDHLPLAFQFGKDDDKDGLVMGLLAAEILAKTGRDPSQLFAGLTAELGTPFYERIDVPATPKQKNALKALGPDQLGIKELAGEPVRASRTKAPGNDQSFGGIKVETDQGWFAARPSGTEDVYKIYAESFRDQAHLKLIQQDARAAIAKAF
jgi:hypothetical protein